MKTYIFGHKRPDTDTVCSSIAYAYLKQQLGMDAEARVLGDINLETKFVLNYFEVEEPKYLNDVKVQIRNMKYLKDAYIYSNLSMNDAFSEMQKLNVTGLPMVDEEKNLRGYVNLKDICKYIVDGDLFHLNTTYDNILKTVNAHSILKFDDEITGNLIVAAYNSKTFMENINLSENDILIVGDRENIIKYAIDSKVKMLIITGDYKLSADLFILANKNRVNTISTSSQTYVVSSRVRLSNYVELACNQRNPIYFNTRDYRDDFINIAEKSNHTNYPVVDNKENCVGMIRLVDQNSYEKCNVILVDHNQSGQSVDGLNEANILEVVDHHNIGFQTNSPISFRVMPVGCTATILYKIFMENKIEIPRKIAGCMLSAILSDTLLFKSPTTTELDKETANKLADIASVKIEEYGMEMLKAGTSIKGMDIEEIFDQDFKSFKCDDANIGISQVMTLNIDGITENQDAYINLLNDMAKRMDYKVVLMFVTDVIKEGSYVFFNEKAKDIVANAYSINELYQGIFMPGVVSRKKQMLPKLLEYLQK